MKIKIKLKIKSTNEEAFFLETIGEYKNNKIVFKDKEEETTVFFGNTIKINKTAENYTLNLKFLINKKSKALYEIKSPFCSINTYIFTKKIVKEPNYLNIEYDLFLEDNKEGSFEIELSWSNL